MARRSLSIAAPIAALVIASVVVAALVLFAVTFNGPPPEPPGGMAEVAAVLRGGAPPRDGRPMRQARTLPSPPVAAIDQHADPAAAEALARALGVPASEVVAFTRRPSGSPIGFMPGDDVVAWRTPAGWRTVGEARPRFLTRWHWQTIAAMLAAVAALALPAWLVARALSSPLAALADAAGRAGTGAPLPALPTAWREVRDLAGAVGTMHRRLAAHAEARTAMLAGMAHDLGTPLSRIAFRLEALPDEARHRALADVAEMRAMIAATLAFARAETRPADSTRLDLGSLIESVVDDAADAGGPVTAEPGPRAIVRGDPGALRRLLTNLIDNAVRYGTRATVSWQLTGGSVAIHVDDDGPGIGPDDAERLFQPFVRGDPSRSRETGGTGLGLAIVRSIAVAHDGSDAREPAGQRGAGAGGAAPRGLTSACNIRTHPRHPPVRRRRQTFLFTRRVAMRDDDHDHGHGMADDLPLMQAMMARRRALKWFAGAGTAAIVAGCGGEGGSSSSGSVSVVQGGTTTATPTATATATPTPTPTATSTASGCIVDPAETAGPYPADGTNSSSGSTSNVLTASGIVRSDIRASFISTTTVATGVLVRITLTLVNVNAACAPLAGYAIYLWHCDRHGRYSLYTVAAESYLRGVQVTDANGQVTFTTIFPGCYDGRWPHMHFEVFSSLSNALGGRFSILTSQLAMPRELSAAIYTDTATYPSSASVFATASLSTDNVFGDNTAAQIAQQTPAFTGSAASGYTATALIGIAR